MMNHFFDMYVRTCITYIVVFDNTVVPVSIQTTYMNIQMHACI
jgi:hypothetical protein